MAKSKITKSITGQYRVGYDCPGCGERLRSPLTDAGTSDQCPDCLAAFVVPGAKQLAKLRQRQEHEGIEKRKAAQLKREEKERKREEREAERAKQRQERDQHRREIEQREEPKCDTCGSLIVAGTVRCDGCSEEEILSPNTSAFLTRRRFSWALSLLPTYFVIQWLRNYGLRDKLDRCETSGVVNVKVYYDGLISTNQIVFDLRDGGTSSARRIDPVHLLMQFADKLDLYSVRRIILARNGKHVFFLSGRDLERNADSYAGGGRVWAFNNLPEIVREMNGKQPFGSWTGGWLGVLMR